jgi:hypothetical protein
LKERNSKKKKKERKKERKKENKQYRFSSFQLNSLFGKAKGEYDFEGKDIEKVQKELKKLQDEQSKLAKNLNRKVMSMFEK